MDVPHPIDTMPEEAFRWFLTGLTDGEGSFIIAKTQRHARHRPTWTTRFQIRLRDDDGAGLSAIFRRMNCGTMHRWKGSGPSKPNVQWQVSDILQVVAVIVPHFERYPLQMKKSRDFLIWKEAASLIHAVRRRKRVALRCKGVTGGTKPKMSDAELESISLLRAQLKAVRQYASPPEASLPLALPVTRLRIPQPLLPWDGED